MFFLYRDFLCIDVIPNIQDNIYAQKIFFVEYKSLDVFENGKGLNVG